MGSVPSQAAQVMITIIPIVGIVVAGVIVLLAFTAIIVPLIIRSL